MMDADGAFTYSKSVAVTFDVGKEGLSLVSATAGNIRVAAYSNSIQKGSLVLLGIDGKLLYRQPVMLNKGLNNFDIPTLLNTGNIGIVTLYSGKSIYTLKVVR
jgi:hypothetical protein